MSACVFGACVCMCVCVSNKYVLHAFSLSSLTNQPNLPRHLRTRSSLTKRKYKSVTSQTQYRLMAKGQTCFLRPQRLTPGRALPRPHCPIPQDYSQGTMHFSPHALGHYSHCKNSIRTTGSLFALRFFLRARAHVLCWVGRKQLLRRVRNVETKNPPLKDMGK